MRLFWRNDRGATAVEFALVAPLLLLMLFSIIEVGMMSVQAAMLDNSLTAASRRIRTGQADAPATAAAFETLVCQQMGRDNVDCREKLVVSVRRFTSFANAAAAAAAPPAGEFDPGQAESIMLVKAAYRWPLLTPFLSHMYPSVADGEVLLDARFAFKNEPYA